MKRSEYLYEINLAISTAISSMNRLAELAGENIGSAMAYFEAQTQVRRLLKLQAKALNMKEDE